ncbi:MAG: regulatory protein RecX [Candidatus Omnitrophota bacterium]
MEEHRRALNYSFLLLKYRLRSRDEIARRLKRKKFSSSAIDTVLQFLEDYKLIDDKKFVVLFIESRFKRGYGREKIRFDLSRFGIPAGLANEQIGKIKQDDYINMIRVIAEKRSKCYKGKMNIRARLFRFLQQRGFQVEEIQSALRDVTFK